MKSSFSGFGDCRATLRIALPLLLIALAASGCQAGFIDSFVADETGFDGAVSVLSAHTDGDFGLVAVRLPYLNIYGEAREGRARLVIHRDQVEIGQDTPIFCHVHYEMGVDGAKKWAGLGWAVFSAVYNEEAPIDVSPGDGNNLARALIQWARRCSFTDGMRLHLDGGSQGGYMALAMSADMFPVTSTTADAPVVNWAYNFAYFEANRPLVAAYAAPFEAPLPVMAAVLPLADMAYEHFTDDMTDDTWHRLSPIAYVDRIANPVLVVAGTGDMLVPMEQMTRNHLHPHDPEAFPEGYGRDFDAVSFSEKARRRFDECLPEGQVFTHIEPLQEHSYVVTLEMRLGKDKHPDKKPQPVERVWSVRHQWNLFYLDEGPPLPFSDHFTYAWQTVPDSFVAHYRDAAPAPEILNAPKLKRLIERYANAMEELPALKNGQPTNRRNFDYVERLDVVSGLLRYAEWGDAYAARLKDLYQVCPHKPFGDALNLAVLRQTLEATTP